MVKWHGDNRGGVKQLWVNSREQRGVIGDRQRISHRFVDQTGGGRDRGVPGEVVTLRIHWSEDVHVL